MNKPNAVFTGEKVVAAFVTAGDSTAEASAALMEAAARGGAGLIVLGIPFSDPTAEGAALQAASIRALAAGISTDRVFDLAAAAPLPVVIYSYLNPVFRYGYEHFFRRCEAAGVCGVILPDLPYEEAGEVRACAEAHGVAVITIVTPASGARIPMLVEDAKGFIYALGFTDPEELAVVRGIIREQCDLPLLAGGGDPALASVADGILVDAPIAELVANRGAAAPEDIMALIGTLKQAV